MWTSVNPLRLRLVCEQLRCPYDLPLEGKYHRRSKNPSWLSSLISGSNTSSVEIMDIKPHTNTVVVHTQQEEEKKKEEEDVEKKKKMESSKDEYSTNNNNNNNNNNTNNTNSTTTTTTTTDSANNSNNRSSPTPTDGEREGQRENIEEIPNMITIQPIHTEENESKVLKGNFNKDTTNYVANSTPQSGRVSLSSEEMHESPLVRSPRESRKPQHEIIGNDHSTCDVAVGTDNNNNNNKKSDDQIGDLHSESKSIESNILPEFSTFEKLLSNTVERLYTKLQGTALKVVALDDLNQQLLENMPHLERDNTVKDKTEMALYLYSLKRQLEILKTTWDEQESLRLASKDHDVMRRGNSTKPLRVEVVRAYEETPVPYKKHPFTPVAYKKQPVRTQNVSSLSSSISRNSISSYVTSSRSTLLSSKMKTSSYDSSSSTSYFSSVATYSDDFEDE